MIDRLKSIRESVDKTRKVSHGKETRLEKGDFLALVLAAWSTLGKTALYVLLFFVAVTAVIGWIWFH